MAFEERTARVSVDVEDVALDDRLDLVLLSTVLLGVSNRELEDVTVPIQGELVHRVNLVELKKHEEET